ncbi:MAG: hypothetical protein ABFC21_02080, partial [Rectinema sp.]
YKSKTPAVNRGSVVKNLRKDSMEKEGTMGPGRLERPTYCLEGKTKPYGTTFNTRNYFATTFGTMRKQSTAP